MEYNSPEFRKWLDKLQRESWQLELIISGFAIYGLFAGYEAIEINGIKANVRGHVPISVFWVALKSVWSILTFNLLLHVLLRGLWIGAVGLRYVSGDIDYQKLDYSEKFARYLHKKVGSFDRYISRLENYCSILFAVTFLLIFYVLGFFLVFFIMLGMGFLLEQMTFIQKDTLEIIGNIFGLVFSLSALIVFTDFIGQGFLKRRKWTSKIYFPIYWVFSKLTLSFLYRPLAYNFLDNKFGRRLSFWLVPIYIGIVTLNGISYKDSSYLSNRGQSAEAFTHPSNYENELTKASEFIKVAAVPSKVIQNSFLKVFMVYDNEIEDFVLAENDSLKLENDTRGFTHFFIENVGITVKGEKVKEAVQANDLKKYLKTINQLYELKIDSVAFDSDFVVTRNQREQLGFETYLNIKNLSQGRHTLTITGPAKEIKYDEDSETIDKVLVTIPFWYYKE